MNTVPRNVVIKHIIPYLGIIDQVQLSTTNKYYYIIISDVNQISEWKDVYIMYGANDCMAHAAFHGHIDIVRLMFKKAMDSKWLYGYFQHKPQPYRGLYQAAYMGHLKIVELMFKYEIFDKKHVRKANLLAIENKHNVIKFLSHFLYFFFLT